MQPPFADGQPTPEVTASLLKSTIEKLSLADGDLVIVRLAPEYRQKLPLNKAKFWVQACLMKLQAEIGRSKVGVVFLDDGVKLEKVPLKDLRNILEARERALAVPAAPGHQPNA
jgi:hypothetical protein